MKSRSALVPLFFVALLAGCSSRRAQAPRIPKIGDRQTGEASWYGDPYHGRRAANGEVYDMEKLTAAHRTLAFDTWLRVENLDNKKSVVVRIIDRGPFVDGRIIDLSRAAAREIDMLRAGVAKVRLEVIERPEQDDGAPGRFSLQTGAFREESNARDHAERMKIYTSEVSVIFDAQVSLWRVRAGSFTTAGKAEGLASRLRDEVIESFVVEMEH
jgi:rare lipoprotein A